MSAPVIISAFATWTPGGVSVGRAPVAGEGRALGPWPQAPELSSIHPRARRPHPSARALVQLAHALLVEREARGGAPGRAVIGLSLGSLAGSTAADVDFHAGVLSRGPSFGSPATFVYTLASAAPGEMSIALGLKAGLFTVSAGRSSGLAAVVQAAARVATGRCQACLCGGFEAVPPGAPGPESISLFLLERAGDTGGHRQADGAAVGLLAWSAGFGTEPPVAPVEGEPLHALARAAASAGGSSLPIASASPEGHWAMVTVERAAGSRASDASGA